MRIFNFQANWQTILLILLVLAYSVYCTEDFFSGVYQYNKLKEAEEIQQFVTANNETSEILKVGKGPISRMLTEWLLGLSASALALFLIFKGQKATIKEAEQHVKIELLSKHINKLNENKAVSADFYAQIEKQFAVWNLSKSESEIAILLLKGLSFKEMAEIRGSNDKTVRQQASSIYKKSELKGRSEFSGYFFEEILMLEMEQRSAES